MATIETDYLVVGAGATGMSFTDTMLEQSDRDVVLVDRRHRPGGHWTDAYPFVRLHQPAAFYGVASAELRGEHDDPTDGRQGLATCAEVCDYYLRVLGGTFLPSGRVHWLPCTDFVGGDDGSYQLRSLVSGETTTVSVRRKLVDARYPQMSIPKHHTPSFGVDDDVRFLPPNDLVDLDRPASGYTVLGAGKTSMDTCHWLLEHGVEPDRIRWVRPRDGWTFDRSVWRTDDDGLNFMQMQSAFLAAMAEAESVDDFYHRLEKAGFVHRLDPTIEPEVFRGPTLSTAEREQLQRIENVVRLGRVTHVGRDKITLEQGDITNDIDQVVVDCTAAGVGAKEPAPIFRPGRIDMNMVTFGIIPWSAALIAWFEAHRDDDVEKNVLCPPTPFTGEASDILHTFAVTLAGTGARMADPDFGVWEDQLRLNPANGFMASTAEKPEATAALGAMMTNMAAAMENIERLVGPSR